MGRQKTEATPRPRPSWQTVSVPQSFHHPGYSDHATSIRSKLEKLIDIDEPRGVTVTAHPEEWRRLIELANKGLEAERNG